jgi:hypothetical protein
MPDATGPNGGSEVPSQRLSAERIAALIDARVSDEERDAIMQQLGESDEDLDVMLDAAAAVADMNQSSVPADRSDEDVIPLSSVAKRSTRWRAVTFVGISAALAATALVMVRSSRARNAEAVGTPGEMVAALTDQSALPADWNYNPWNAQRGDPSIRDSALYVRIGVRAVDVELAARAGDTAISRLASDMDVLLERVPGGSAASVFYRRVAEDPNGAELLPQARRALQTLSMADLIALGAWLETARIAASRHDEKWFNLAVSQRMLRRISEIGDSSPAEKAATGEILRDRSTWDSVATSVGVLLRRW